MADNLEGAAVQDDKRDILDYMKKFRLEEVLNDVSTQALTLFKADNAGGGGRLPAVGGPT